VLAALGDLDGIWGSFVLSGRGDLLLWDVPQEIGEEALDGVAPRLTRLCQALARDGRDVELCMLRFAQHRLCLRAAGSCTLAVLTTTAVNVPALKMAMTVASRRLGEMLMEE